MINKLYLDGCFTHQDTTFEFKNGLTGIIGPNESGKSLIVEMIRYALFGTKALRGKLEDYKKLHVELEFTVDQTYTVVRKGIKVQLLLDENVIASGTKPVDQAIENILGYDLNVFDIANACNQGNVEALSSMTPTARKAMVDKTIGLNVLDTLVTFTGHEANALKREAEAVSVGMVEPVEPTKPEGYQASGEIDVASARAELAEYNQLKGFLAQAPIKPKKPKKCRVKETSEELRKAQSNRQSIISSIDYLTKQKAKIVPEVYSDEDLEKLEAQHVMHHRMQQRDQLLAQGHNHCPSCDHEWPLAAEELKAYEDVTEVSKPEVSRAEINTHRASIGNNKRIEDLQSQLNTLVIPDDRSEDVSIRQQYDTDLVQYDQQIKAYNIYNEQLIAKQERFAELEGVEEKVTLLQDQFQLARQFEMLVAQYQTQLSDYEKRVEQVNTLTFKSDEFFKARKIILALKVSVKTHLIPSLNKVASVLLSRMTGGERYSVVIDEDFEILIDDQRINTLSGSGKAVANLAIRIALGQILTNRVFSVFLADEVDAAMDDDRASYTAEALRRLTDNISQVILITHKRPETDYIFELKK